MGLVYVSLFDLKLNFNVKFVLVLNKCLLKKRLIIISFTGPGNFKELVSMFFAVENLI